MLARLQKILTLSLLGAAAGIAAWSANEGHALRGAAIALLIVFGYALVLGVEFVLLHWVSRGEPGPRATAGQLLRAWWGEVRAMPQVFFWRQPFRSHAEPDHLPSSARGERGVVLVHGFVCNRGFWNPWLRELRARGVPFVAVDLEPVFASIDAYAPLIEEAVARLEAATGVPGVLVGHSMGGLAIRTWLRRFGADPRVHRVVTIGSPHRGTWLARLALAPNATQMRLASPWLAELTAASRSGAGGSSPASTALATTSCSRPPRAPCPMPTIDMCPALRTFTWLRRRSFSTKSCNA